MGKRKTTKLSHHKIQQKTQIIVTADHKQNDEEQENAQLAANRSPNSVQQANNKAKGGVDGVQASKIEVKQDQSSKTSLLQQKAIRSTQGLPISSQTSPPYSETQAMGNILSSQHPIQKDTLFQSQHQVEKISAANASITNVDNSSHISCQNNKGTIPLDQQTQHVKQFQDCYFDEDSEDDGEYQEIYEDYGLEQCDGQQTLLSLENASAVLNPVSSQQVEHSKEHKLIGESQLIGGSNSYIAQFQKIENPALLQRTTRTNRAMMSGDDLRLGEFVLKDKYIKQDIQCCLYYIYNCHDVQDYYQQLLNLSKRLKDWGMQATPDILIQLFTDCIQEFIHGIRDRLLKDIEKLQLITHRRPLRTYSYDDYFLIERSVTKNYQLTGFSNEVFHHKTKYMGDSRYEQVRVNLRRQIWSEWRDSTEVIVPLVQNPSSYQKFLDTIVKFYTRVRDTVIGIEEIWVFLLEQVFDQELKGNLIFDAIHKRMFNLDILGHKHIQMFFRGIREAYKNLEIRRQRNPEQLSNLDPVIDNLFDLLQQLDRDINFQPHDIVEKVQQPQHQQQAIVMHDQAANPDMVQQNPEHDQVIDCVYEEEESDIITYKQLHEHSVERFDGLTFTQKIEQMINTSIDYQNMLETIKADKNCQEILKRMPNLDAETLCLILQNNLPIEDYENMINNPNTDFIDQQSSSSHSQDDIYISPTKNLVLQQGLPNSVSLRNVLNQFQHTQLQYSAEEEQRQMEKKRKKNQKKKQKRKEKKILAQHQIQLEEIIKQRLEIKQQSNSSQLTHFLLENMNEQDTIELRNYIQNHSRLQPLNYQLLEEGDSGGPDPNYQATFTDEDDEDEALDDPQSADAFERELELFSDKLLASQQSKQRKLIPNVSPSWLTELKTQIIKQQSNYNSPRQNSAAAKVIGQQIRASAAVEGGQNNQRKDQRIKQHQRSA